MKICPSCRRTYDDDGLNFCLEDGSVLTFSSLDSAAPTIAMHQPRPTEPSPQIRAGWDAQQPQGVAAYPTQPKKKSKAWLWALSILGLAVLLCGGGLVGFFVYVASVANTNTASNVRVASNSSNTHANSNSSWTTSSPSPDPSQVEEVDLSDWVRKTPTEYGTTEFANGEFLMASRQKGYFYVLVAPNDYETKEAVTHVTVRNPDNADSSLGYGLIIHSDTEPLKKDLAFLIDSKKQRFRVVRHDSDDETAVTPWTSSKLVNEGTAENILEVRDKGGKIDLYINGQLASTFANKTGPKSGVPGLYAGDGAKIGFKKLEIIK